MAFEMKKEFDSVEEMPEEIIITKCGFKDIGYTVPMGDSDGDLAEVCEELLKQYDYLVLKKKGGLAGVKGNLQYDIVYNSDGVEFPDEEWRQLVRELKKYSW